MQSELKGLEVEAAVAGDDDPAIEDAPLGKLSLQNRDELREVPVERLLIATLDEELFDVAKDQRTKAVPLGLENPIVAGRQLGDAIGQHRKYGWIYGKVHELAVGPLAR